MEALGPLESAVRTSGLMGSSSRRILTSQQQTRRRLLACFLVALLGLVALSPVLVHLWVSWTTDALRSIGMFFPILSIIFTLRVWRRLDWETHGTWWGLLPLIYSLAAAHAEDNTLVHVVLTSQVNFSLLSRGLTMFSYGSGVILLCGGCRLWRQAVFPLALLLFVDPAPHFFNSVIDLPLQYISAQTTRAFALAIGVRPNGEQLRLMFAPQFGMFIAPGCNGIRGGLTMGYLGLILGYIYKLSIRLRIFTVICALALGYLFNLVRLCVLVLYYWLALRLHPLQAHAEVADYIIGVVLFGVATVLFFLLIRGNGKKMDELPPVSMGAQLSGSVRTSGNKSYGWKCLVASALIVVSASPYIYSDSVLVLTRSTHEEPKENYAGIFPAQLGEWKLLKTWQERDAAQELLYSWGSYSSDSQAGQVEVGVWSPTGVHHPIGCHLSRGEKPVWNAIKTLPIADGDGTFQITAYQDGDANLVEASTICTTSGCYESGIVPFRKGITFRNTGIRNFIFQPFYKSRPLLIRKQTTVSTTSLVREVPQTIAELQAFISQLNQSQIRRFVETQNR
jgi:exosortase J